LEPDLTVGRSILRKEGVRKVTGSAMYVDDVPFEGLHGVTVRSTVARGKIKSIQFLDGVNWSEFTIVTAKDIPGKNTVALIIYDQPFLADGIVNHPDEAILLLAHPDKYLAEKARSLVKVEYDKLPAVFSIEDALSKKAVIWGQDNILKSYLLEKGDVGSVWKNADLVVEAEYFTGAQEQLYIEPNGISE
jgi:CO/xanthine dehydrogenase Mo-binding subunit